MCVDKFHICYLQWQQHEDIVITASLQYWYVLPCSWLTKFGIWNSMFALCDCNNFIIIFLIMYIALVRWICDKVLHLISEILLESKMEAFSIHFRKVALAVYNRGSDRTSDTCYNNTSLETFALYFYLKVFRIIWGRTRKPKSREKTAMWKL